MCYTIAGKTKCSPWSCVENSFTLLCRENEANDVCSLRLEKQLPRRTSASISVIFINCYEFSQWPFCTINWQNHSAGISTCGLNSNLPEEARLIHSRREMFRVVRRSTPWQSATIYCCWQLFSVFSVKLLECKLNTILCQAQSKSCQNLHGNGKKITFQLRSSFHLISQSGPIFWSKHKTSALKAPTIPF